MFDIVCNYPLTSDLFAQAIHPTKSIIAIGLSSGHVETIKLPPLEASTQPGNGQIETLWKTKRHKISCRVVTYSPDGETLFSAGADGIIKAANSMSGQVTSKLVIPPHKNTGELDPATVIHNLSEQTLILGTDSAALHIYDLRTAAAASQTPQATYRPHADYITSLTPLPSTEASTSGLTKQWVSVGGTTLAVTDLRKGVIAQSLDQETELLSCTFVKGLKIGKHAARTSTGGSVVVGDGAGALTTWQRGSWNERYTRLVLDPGIRNAGLTPAEGGESIDCLAIVPASIAGNEETVVAGMGNGLIACIELGRSKNAETFQHELLESVSTIGFDVEDRMISGGGMVIKVWRERGDLDGDDGGEDVVVANGHGEKRSAESDGNESDDQGEDNESDSDFEKPGKQSKKKKRRKDGKNKKAKSQNHMGLFNGLD